MMLGRDNDAIRPSARPNNHQKCSNSQRQQTLTTIIKRRLELIRTIQQLIDTPPIDNQHNPDHRYNNCLLLMRRNRYPIEHIIQHKGKDGGRWIDRIINSQGQIHLEETSSHAIQSRDCWTNYQCLEILFCLYVEWFAIVDHYQHYRRYLTDVTGQVVLYWTYFVLVRVQETASPKYTAGGHQDQVG
jgi:hypothetical protein